MGLHQYSVVKKSTYKPGDLGWIPGSGRSLGQEDPLEISWRTKWQPTLVILPGKSHGQRSLVGYSPWGHKESDTTWPLTAAPVYDRVPV